MRTGTQAPHPAAAGASWPAALALLVHCGFCWAVPGTSCTEFSQHYARYLGTDRRGLLAAAGLAAVSAAAAHITAGTVVPDAQTLTQ